MAEAGTKWYYAVGDKKNGPLSQAQFDELVAKGAIWLETLVWRKVMPEWQPLAEVRQNKGLKDQEK